MHGIDKPAVYRITVRGVLDPEWSDRLSGMRITLKPSRDITLSGRLADQAALAGVLETLYQLHLTILEVKRLKEKPQ